jgi:hypothetical protein
MKQRNKYIIGGVILALLILWSNRDSFTSKKPLDMSPNDGVDAIKEALRKIKNGQIVVRQMPEEIRKELLNEK